MDKPIRVLVIMTMIILLSFSVFADKYDDLRVKFHKLVDKIAESLINEGKTQESRNLLIGIYGGEAGAKKYDDLVKKFQSENAVRDDIKNAENLITNARTKIENAENPNSKVNKKEAGESAINSLDSAESILNKIDSTKLTQDQTLKVSNLKISIEELTKRAIKLDGKPEKTKDEKNTTTKPSKKWYDNKIIWIIVVIVLIGGGTAVWRLRKKKSAEESSDSSSRELGGEAQNQNDSASVDDALSGFGDVELDVEGIRSALDIYKHFPNDSDDPNYRIIHSIIADNNLGNIYGECEICANNIIGYISLAKGTEVSESVNHYLEAGRNIAI